VIRPILASKNYVAINAFGGPDSSCFGRGAQLSSGTLCTTLACANDLTPCRDALHVDSASARATTSSTRPASRLRGFVVHHSTSVTFPVLFLSSALRQTQDCLRNQNCDAANTHAGNAAAQKAWESVGGNSANNQALYNIAAEIVPILVQQSDGDPAKMQTILMKAETDPESFVNSLPLEIQEKIKNVAITADQNQFYGQKP
jgi:hypothetical protein